MKKLLLSILFLLNHTNLYVTQKLDGILSYIEKTTELRHKNSVERCRFLPENNTLLSFKTYNQETRDSGAEVYNSQQKKFIATALTPIVQKYPELITHKINPALFILINYLKGGAQTRLYDSKQTNSLRALFSGGKYAGFAGNQLFVPSQDKKSLTAYNLQTGRRNTLPLNAQLLRSAQSPDGNNILLVLGNGKLWLYMGKHGDIFSTNTTTNSEFSKDSKYLVYDYQKSIYLFDIEKKKNTEIAKTKETLRQLKFSPNGDYVLYSYDSKTWYYYNIATHKPTTVIFSATALPDKASPDGTILSYHKQKDSHLLNKISLFNLKNKKLKTLKTDAFPLHAWFNKNNTYFAISEQYEKGVTLYHYPSLEKCDTISIKNEEDYSIPHFSPDNTTMIVTPGKACEYKVYNIEKKEVIATGTIGYFNHEDHAFKFHPNPERKLVFIVNDDHKSLEIMNYTTGESHLLSTEIPITAFNINKNGTQLIVSFGSISKIFNIG